MSESCVSYLSQGSDYSLLVKNIESFTDVKTPSRCVGHNWIISCCCMGQSCSLLRVVYIKYLSGLYSFCMLAQWVYLHAYKFLCLNLGSIRIWFYMKHMWPYHQYVYWYDHNRNIFRCSHVEVCVQVSRNTCLSLNMWYVKQYRIPVCMLT